MGAGETGGVFLAGAAAGIFEGIVVQPMEMVKTRFQINTGQSMRIIPTMRAIVAEGGGAGWAIHPWPYGTGAPCDWNPGRVGQHCKWGCPRCGAPWYDIEAEVRESMSANCGRKYSGGMVSREREKRIRAAATARQTACVWHCCADPLRMRGRACPCSIAVHTLARREHESAPPAPTASGRRSRAAYF